MVRAKNKHEAEEEQRIGEGNSRGCVGAETMDKRERKRRRRGKKETGISTYRERQIQKSAKGSKGRS